MTPTTWERYLAANATAPDLFAALTDLVTALDPEPDSGDLCQVCRCEMPEYDEPHGDCAYAVARRMAGRGPETDGGSALVGDPGRRAVGVDG